MNSHFINYYLLILPKNNIINSNCGNFSSTISLMCEHNRDIALYKINKNVHTKTSKIITIFIFIILYSLHTHIHTHLRTEQMQQGVKDGYLCHCGIVCRGEFLMQF